MVEIFFNNSESLAILYCNLRHRADRFLYVAVFHSQVSFPVFTSEARSVPLFGKCKMVREGKGLFFFQSSYFLHLIFENIDIQPRLAMRKGGKQSFLWDNLCLRLSQEILFARERRD